jgi:hypothetical protein
MPVHLIYEVSTQSGSPRVLGESFMLGGSFNVIYTGRIVKTENGYR